MFYVQLWHYKLHSCKSLYILVQTHLDHMTHKANELCVLKALIDSLCKQYYDLNSNPQSYILCTNVKENPRAAEVYQLVVSVYVP